MYRTNNLKATSVSQWAQHLCSDSPPRVSELEPPEIAEIRGALSHSSTPSMVMTEETAKTAKTLANRLQNRGIELGTTNDNRLKTLLDTIKAGIKPSPIENLGQLFQGLRLSIVQAFDNADSQSLLI